MKVSALARLLLGGFVAIFALAAVYILLDSLGVWNRIPFSLTRAIEWLTGLILLGTLAGHLLLATGRLPEDATKIDRS